MIKLIYILGFARSGTTILGNLLGEVDGFVHVGELCRLWRRAALHIGRCGCTQKMTSCPVWSKVIPRALENVVGAASPRSLEEWGAEGLKMQKKAEAHTSLAALVGGRKAGPELRDYGRLMEEVLKEVATVSDARVIVDSSKLILPSAYATEMPSIRPYFIHVIRDSRGAVLSRQRKRAPRKGEDVVLKTKTTVADCFRWARSNVVPRFLERNGHEQLILRYENFVSDPAGTLRSILAWVDEPAVHLPLSDNGTARFGVNHTVCGNRNRFNTGEVRFVLDDAWRRTLRSRDYLLITALTAPLLARYGYGMRRTNGASRGSSTHAERLLKQRTPTDPSASMQRIKSRFRGVLDSVLVHSPAQPIARHRTARQLVVLAYHRVEDPATFRRHVEYLARSKTIVSAGEVFEACRPPGKALPPDAVLITFDDADRSLLEEGLPILRTHRTPALAFVVAGHLGTRRPFWWREVELLLDGGARAAGYPSRPDEMVRVLKGIPDAERRGAIRRLRRSAPEGMPKEAQLTESEVRALSDGGIEIGNHTMTHPILDRCNSRRIRSEIIRAHRKLTDIVGTPIRAFAYPNGNWHADAERTLQELGCEGAFLFDHRCSDSPPENRFRISRVRVGSSTPLSRFRLILSGLHPMIHHAAGRS